MDTRSLLLSLLVALLVAPCDTTVAQIRSEKLKVRLTDKWVELVGEDSMASFKLTDSSIVNEDAFPIVKVPAVPPAGRSVRQFTPIIVNAVITKRGNVKRAWIVSSESPYFNKAVLKAVIQWKYQPRIVNGIPHDTLITIEIPVR